MNSEKNIYIVPQAIIVNGCIGATTWREVLRGRLPRMMTAMMLSPFNQSVMTTLLALGEMTIRMESHHLRTSHTCGNQELDL